MTTYGVTREFGGTLYTMRGYTSHEDAELAVFRRAYADGNWQPRRLREKWWQVWRPAEHNEIEKTILSETDT